MRLPRRPCRIALPVVIESGKEPPTETEERAAGSKGSPPDRLRVRETVQPEDISLRLRPTRVAGLCDRAEEARR